MADPMLTVGKDKQKVPVAQATDEQLRYYAERGNHPATVAAVRAELERRSGSAPLARAGGEGLAHLVHDPIAVSKRFEQLAQRFHVVTPATHVDVLPPGCGIAISYVQVDPNPDPYKGPKEVYDVGGRLGLSMVSLQRIAAAAGLEWVPELTGRIDDGRDPHYCHYRAVGRVRNFDMSLRIVTGEVEIDARDDSPLIEEIITKARAKKRKPDQQIMELRKFLLRHAESKAKNRAIADMGVKRSYAPDELAKPFAIARLTWTGQTDDPELKREFARMNAQRMLGATDALYGPASRALPAPPPSLRRDVAVEDTDPWADWPVASTPIDVEGAATSAPARSTSADLASER